MRDLMVHRKIVQRLKQVKQAQEENKVYVWQYCCYCNEPFLSQGSMMCVKCWPHHVSTATH